MRDFFKKLLKPSKNQNGQILVVVLILIVVLLIVVLAVVFNVISDIGQTTTERRYEEGYAAAEGTLFQISNNLDTAELATAVHNNDIANFLGNQDARDLTGFRDLVAENSACIGQRIDGIIGSEYHESGNNCASAEFDSDGDGSTDTICHFEEVYGVFSMELEQDETLEVNLNGLSGSSPLQVTIEGINPAVSVAVVYLDPASGAYTNERFALTSNSGFGSGFSLGNSVQVKRANNPQFMRIRAVGGRQILSVHTQASGANRLPSQMLNVICRGISTDVEFETASGSPIPTVYTQIMIQKRLPALFDYVLFVGNGEVRKSP